MRGFSGRGLALCALLMGSVLPVQAQTYTYSVYVDRDRDPSSGCSAVLPGSTDTVAGAETRLVATVDQPTLQVVRVERQACVSGAFDAGVTVGGPHPLGLDNGVGGADVVELSDALPALIGGQPMGNVRLYFAAQSEDASDALFTRDGQPGGVGIFASTPFLIPTAGLGGLLLLGSVVMLVAWRVHRRSPAAVRASALLLLAGAGVAIAASFSSDGQVGDWIELGPLASDPAGDSTDGSQALDIRAAFVAIESDRIYFRIDVTDAQNNTPVAIPQTVTLLEDSGATTLTLAGTDLDNEALSFVIVTPPTRGVLGPVISTGPTSATVTYTPDADVNGSDSFEFRVSDAQMAADEATVAITLSPVNDAPAFTATNPPAVNEDAGAQSIAGWASFDPGPPDEAGQTATYLVSALGNAALFSAPPAVAPDGTLSYTPAADANGSSTFEVRVRDSGGTADGGIDTSPAQTITITVNAINDAPSFVRGSDVVVAEDAGAQTLSPWATAISAGPSDESGQALAFSVTGNTNPGIFSAGPAVSASGILTFTPAADANGIATITLALSDDGPGSPPPNANTSPEQTFTITVDAVNDAPVNSVPGIQSTGDTTPLVFSAANGNAIGVTDVDAAAGLVRMSFSTGAAGNGILMLANPGGVLATLTGNGTQTVTATGTITALNAALNGPSGALTYTPVSGTSAARVLTVTTDDQGNTGAGGAQLDIDTITINVDAPPTVSSTPADGATIAENAAIQIAFDEPVNVAAGIIFTCTGGTLSGVGGLTGSGVTVLDLSYSGVLGGTCTLTVPAASVTDVDTIDPPDAPLADYVATFSVDAAPDVVAVSPADGATQVANNLPLTVDFSEAVTLGAAAITLDCGAPIAGSVSSVDADTWRFTPAAALPEGSACSAEVVAAQVSDVDSADPPDNLAANFAWSFTTDAAPSVVSVTPADAAVVGTGQVLSVTFSEDVGLTAGAFTLDCAGPITLTAVPALPASNVATITLTPASPLPAGAACTFTVVASEVADSDAGDPPDALAADFVRSFSVDAAPTVLSTLPAAGATSVDPGANITISFSEPVAFDTAANAANASFDLECPAGQPTAFSVATASPAASVVLDPLDSAVAGLTCTLSVRRLGISDDDSADPPDTLDADFSASFSFAALANDDSYVVTPHLSLAIPAAGVQGGGVIANDVLGAGTITGYGLAPACAGTSPGAPLDGGPANGRLTLAADGSFTYEPPAGVANATRTFCYTVTGGDTANIAFNLQNTELVWFVDSAAAAGGTGTQGRPLQTLNAAAAVDTPGDTLFVASGNYPGTQLQLEANGRMIGAGSTQTLGAFTGISPVAGSGFPALSGIAPVLSCSNVTCLSLSGAGAGNSHSLRGFTIGDSGPGGRDLFGQQFGTLNVAEVTLSGDGALLSLSMGTANGSFLDLDSTAQTSADPTILLSGIGGTLAVVGTVDITNAAAANALSIANQPAGASLSFSGGLNVSTAGAVTLVNCLGTTSLGNVVLASSATGTALGIQGCVGTSITGGSITAASASPALLVDSSTVAVTLAGVSGRRLTLANVTGSVQIGAAGSLAGAGAGEASVALLGATAGTTLSYAGSVSKTTSGPLASIQGLGSATLSGNLSCTGACGTGAGASGLFVSKGGGNATFSGASKVFSSSATNPGVNLSNNTGATIDFTGGGLAITTAGGTGFNATGGGSVSVQGSGNTITSSGGTALLVDHPVAQPVNLGFASISAGGATGTHGIRLNNISGSVAVSGATSIGARTTAGIEISNSSAAVALSTASTVTLGNRPSTGIRIANASGNIGFGNTIINSTGVGTPAIRIDASSSAITFAQTNIDMNGAGGNEDFLIGAGPSADAYTPRDNAGDGDAIYVTGLTGSLTINGGTITRPGDDGIDIRNSRNLVVSNMSFVEPGRSPAAGCLDCNSSGIQAFALTGSNSVSNSSFLRGRLRNFYISNPSGTTTLNISGSTFDDTRGQGDPATDNLQIYASGTATAAFNISNSTFLKSRTNQINAVTKGNSAITELDITGITMNNDGGASAGIRIDAEEASTLAFNVIGNPVLYSQDENVITASVTGSAQMQGRIANNPDMRFTTASAGGSAFVGMRVLSDGPSSRATVAVTNNIVNVNNGTDGLTLTVQGATAARIDATVIGNTLTAAGAPGIPLDAINAIVNPTLGGSKVLCATLASNTVNGNWTRAARARALSPTATYITGYSGTFAATWAAQGNNSGALTVVESASGGGVISAPPAPCVTPAHPMP